MENSVLLVRFGQFGAAWIGLLILSAAAIAGATWLLHLPLVRIADVVLPISFVVAVLIMLVAILAVLWSPANWLVKAAIVVGGVVLALPLMWAPVLGAVAVAYLMRASIEYSKVYADFRITVSLMLYPLLSGMRGGALQAVWNIFRGLSTVVGFLSGLAQVVILARRIAEGRPIDPTEV